MGMSVSDYICDQKAEHNFEVNQRSEMQENLRFQQLKFEKIQAK